MLDVCRCDQFAVSMLYASQKVGSAEESSFGGDIESACMPDEVHQQHCVLVRAQSMTYHECLIS